MGEENGTFTNEPLYRDFYHIALDTYRPEHHFFTTVADPVRRVAQVVHLLLLAAALVYVACSLRRLDMHRADDAAMLCLLLAVVLFVGGQTVSSPNTTWRYTMPFYQASIVLIVLCARHLTRRLTARREAQQSQSKH